MDGEHENGTGEGKARVRTLFLDRLAEAGMTRRKGVSVEAHEAWTARLVDHLAYMSAENLVTLADLVMGVADGPARNVWPAEVTIRNFAHALQAPPLRERRIVSSWLASIEGPQAEAGGYLVELFRWLRESRVERPPMKMDMRLIREEAMASARRRGLVRDRIERGSASAEDAAWLEAHLADERVARAIVDEGRARRAASDQRGAA